MRIRRLELVRYGGFADRVFDFGERRDGRPDIHLVIGANEAGKSTALQAIGDLLFGIHPQTTQNWRYDYGQLRIRALIEHAGGILDVTRRKGKKDTLLDADGAPFGEDPLAPLLGGIDRAAFERMFGLDHAKLRAGGEGILSNSDDAARITLEAGTGVSNIGREMGRLQEAAASLFKPGGQNPPVNRLMRERADALAEVRQSTIGDAEWAQTRQRRTDAEERRVTLIAEAEKLEREHARLDRLSRARAPLSRLALARAEIDELGAVPVMPADAGARLARARTERTTAEELVAKATKGLDRIAQAIAEVPARGPLMAQRALIEALDERRPVIAQAALDLGRRRAELERVEARIATARREAGLRDGAPLPSGGWRRRAGSHLEALRTLAVREEGLIARGAKLARDRVNAEDALSSSTTGADPEDLRNALGLLPADAEERHAKAASDLRRREAHAVRLVDALVPWRGKPALLAGLDCPSEAEAAEVRRSSESARAELEAAERDAEASETAATRAAATLRKLAAGTALPTPDAVRSVRGARDELLADVRVRLAKDRQEGDEGAGLSLAEAVHRADLLVDRRDAEAARVAEHQLASAALEEARERGAKAEERRERRRGERGRLEAEWGERLSRIGFERPIPPGDWPAWMTRRQAALTAMVERDEASRDLAVDADRLVGARTAIAAALSAAGGGDIPATDRQLLERAAAHAALLAEKTARRIRLLEDIEANEEAKATLDDDVKALDAIRRELGERFVQLVAEGGMADGATPTSLEDAIEALHQIADDVGARDGLARQIDGMERDRRTFDAELDRLLTLVGSARGSDPVAQVRSLAADLHEAIRHEEARERLEAERQVLTADLAAAEARAGSARSAIRELVAAARVEDEAGLDRVLADGARLSAVRVAESEALADLAGLDNGLGLETLEAEVAAVTLEEETVGRATLEERRREVAGEREEVGRALAAAEAEASRVASSTAAADAQQRVVETTAALAQAAEEHVEAAAAAALLRWVVDRHRARNQAPLIARAGQLFAQVTAGAFAKLMVGYGSEDRPVLRAVRPDGSDLGVEALSEGTRDQLYLSLRLASIGSHAVGSNLPIICDDLLITADDERAGELVRVLGTAALTNQVIVFSHHDHLLGVAGNAIGTDHVRVHRIARTIAAA